MISTANRELLVAFDFGIRRIGVAVGNQLTRTATPLDAVVVGSKLPWNSLDKIINAWNPGQLIVGLPDPSHNRNISTECDSFSEELKKRYKLPSFRVDESFTSRAAVSQLKEYPESGIMKKQIKI